MDDFAISETLSFGLLRLQAFHRSEGGVENLERKLGYSLPEPGTSSVHQGKQISCSAPGEWTIAVKAGQELAQAEELREKLVGTFAVLSVITDGYIVLDMKGDRFRDVLARGSTVDFHVSSFREGVCISTRFAAIPVILICQEGGRGAFLLAENSYAAYLLEWFVAAQS